MLKLTKFHTVLLFSLIIFGMFSLINVKAFEYFPSPLKQISNGIAPENVTCTVGLQLVFKISTNSPACVKSSSIDKLIQRGWATLENFFVPNNSEVEIANKAKAILDYTLEKEQNELEGEYIGGHTDDGFPIAFYDISGNDIILINLPPLPSDLLYLQQDVGKHQEIWNVFTKLIPKQSRNVSMFYLTTDGEGGTGGGVERDVENISMWKLYFDILDVYPKEILDEREIIYTIIHEFGHIVTSNPNQIEVDLELINPSAKEELDELFQVKSEACYPKVMVADGCAKSTSYINLFYQKFWVDIVSDWDKIQYIEEDEEFYEQSHLFYEKYKSRFLSIYSATNVDEDIAESWTAFVLRDKPIEKTMAEQKILFFYDFPELVELRNEIRNRL